MLVDLKTVIGAIIGIFTIGGAIVSFFVMQAKQNMEIQHMQHEQEEQKRKASKQTEFQIKTEKKIIEMDVKIDSVDKNMKLVLQLMQELRDKGCGRCPDK